MYIDYKPFAGVTLKDMIVIVMCFQVVGPFVSSLPVFRKTEFGKYIGATLALFFIPLAFNQRTPSIRHILDTNDHILIKALAFFVLLRVMVKDPRPS